MKQNRIIQACWHQVLYQGIIEIWHWTGARVFAKFINCLYLLHTHTPVFIYSNLQWIKELIILLKNLCVLIPANVITAFHEWLWSDTNISWSHTADYEYQHTQASHPDSLQRKEQSLKDSHGKLFHQ